MVSVPVLLGDGSVSHPNHKYVMSLGKKNYQAFMRLKAIHAVSFDDRGEDRENDIVLEAVALVNSASNEVVREPGFLTCALGGYVPLLRNMICWANIKAELRNDVQIVTNLCHDLSKTDRVQCIRNVIAEVDPETRLSHAFTSGLLARGVVEIMEHMPERSDPEYVLSVAAAVSPKLNGTCYMSLSDDKTLRLVSVVHPALGTNRSFVERLLKISVRGAMRIASNDVLMEEGIPEIVAEACVQQVCSAMKLNLLLKSSPKYALAFMRVGQKDSIWWRDFLNCAHPLAMEDVSVLPEMARLTDGTSTLKIPTNVVITREIARATFESVRSIHTAVHLRKKEGLRQHLDDMEFRDEMVVASGGLAAFSCHPNALDDRAFCLHAITCMDRREWVSELGSFVKFQSHTLDADFMLSCLSNPLACSYVSMHAQVDMLTVDWVKRAVEKEEEMLYRLKVRLQDERIRPAFMHDIHGLAILTASRILPGSELDTLEDFTLKDGLAFFADRVIDLKAAFVADAVDATGLSDDELLNALREAEDKFVNMCDEAVGFLAKFATSCFRIEYDHEEDTSCHVNELFADVVTPRLEAAGCGLEAHRLEGMNAFEKEAFSSRKRSRE